MSELEMRQTVQTLQWTAEESATTVDPPPAPVDGGADADAAAGGPEAGASEVGGGGLEWDANEGATIQVGSVPPAADAVSAVQWVEMVRVRGKTARRLPAVTPTLAGTQLAADALECKATRPWPKMIVVGPGTPLPSPLLPRPTAFERPRAARFDRPAAEGLVWPRPEATGGAGERPRAAPYVRRAERYVPEGRGGRDRREQARRLRERFERADRGDRAGRHERHERTQLNAPTWRQLLRHDRVRLALGMTASAVLAFVVALAVLRAPRALAPAAVAAAPVAAAAASGPRVTSLAPVPAVLEAVDALSVRATVATTGTVRRATARGSAVAMGDALVELKRANADASRALGALNELLDEYDGTGTHAAEIARARAAYQRAVAAPAPGVVKAPITGVVVGDTVRAGTALEAGDEVTRVAASARLVLPAKDVEGAGTACRVVLLERKGLILDGRLLPGVAEAGSRTIVIQSFPSELPLGTVGRAKAICD